MQVPLVTDLEPLFVPCLAFRLRAALLLQHASGVCSLLARADVTVGWLLSQLGLVDQISISLVSLRKAVAGLIQHTALGHAGLSPMSSFLPPDCLVHRRLCCLTVLFRTLWLVNSQISVSNHDCDDMILFWIVKNEL